MKAPQMWLQMPCMYALWPLALGLPTCNNNNNNKFLYVYMQHQASLYPSHQIPCLS